MLSPSRFLFAACLASYAGAQPELAVADTVETLGKGVVEKTVVSDNLRLIFVAGMEGSGHHYLMRVINNIYEEDRRLVRMDRCDMIDPYYTSDAMAGSPPQYAQRRIEASTQMQQLAAQRLEEPGTIATMQGAKVMTDGVIHNQNCSAGRGGTMMSYPNNRGASKAMQYVDLRLLAETAEAEGVDFRVVYLQRKAHDIMISDTDHRHFEKKLSTQRQNITPDELYMTYMRILFTDIGVLHSLLMEIDPAFVVCHNYDLTGDQAQARRIADFASPSSEFADRFSESLVAMAEVKDSTSSQEEEVAPEASDPIANRLQQKMDVFESRFCKTAGG